MAPRTHKPLRLVGALLGRLIALIGALLTRLIALIGAALQWIGRTCERSANRVARHLVRGWLRRSGCLEAFDDHVAVRSDAVWLRLLTQETSLALGESYMDGLWSLAEPTDAGRLEGFLRSLASNPLVRKVARGRGWSGLVRALASPFRTVGAAMDRCRNPQSIARSERVAKRHYDVGNDLFCAMLDPRMQYSCAVWDGVDDLDAAQTSKMDLICRKLRLRPGMLVLDVGCGWGGLLDYMQERYGVVGVGVTISVEQARFARERFPGVDIVLEDYRTFCARFAGRFDRVVSVGCFEHVGPRNYRTFFDAMRGVLRRDDDDVLMLLHTIGGNRSEGQSDAFIDRWIFPGGVLPSAAQIGTAIEGTFFVEHWVNLGPHYARTLQAWLERSTRFFASEGGETYPPRFRRMWQFYLVACKIMFSLRQIQLWQIVLRPTDCIGAPVYEVGGIPSPSTCRVVLDESACVIQSVAD